MITVIGLDGSPLSAGAADRLRQARLVVGGARHIAGVEIPDQARTIVLGGQHGGLAGALDAIEERQRAAGGSGSGDLGNDLENIVVLASGDPGFFGIVAALRRRDLAVEVLPAVSSVAAAFARAGTAWDDAAVVSAHGRDPRTAYNACRALPKVAVLTGPDAGAAQLGAALVGWERTLLVAERLGEAGERFTRCTPAEAARRAWAEPNVVLVLDERRHRFRAGGRVENRLHNQVAAPPSGWAGHEDRTYQYRDGMITKWEIRAVALARLRPTFGALVWDVGAGSGSVAVECARMHAAVIAVDSDPRARDLVRRNADRHDVDVRVVDGRAPEVYRELPDPDAVFLGGGGLPALRGALDRRPAAVVAAYAAVDRVVPARAMLRDAGYQVEGTQLAVSRLADLPGGGTRLVAGNPVFLLAGSRS